MPTNEAYERAHRRMLELKGLYAHALTYLTIMLLLAAIDLATPGGPWFQWPLIGWGAVLALHAVSVLGLNRVLGPDWEERKTRELMGPELQPGPAAPRGTSDERAPIQERTEHAGAR